MFSSQSLLLNMPLFISKNRSLSFSYNQILEVKMWIDLKREKVFQHRDTEDTENTTEEQFYSTNFQILDSWLSFKTRTFSLRQVIMKMIAP